MESRTTAMFGGRRKVLAGLLAVAATVLLASSYYLRVTEQFYGLPGFSYKGLEYPTKVDWLLIATSLALFFAGLWGGKYVRYPCTTLVMSFALLTFYDLQTMWGWGSHDANSFLSDFIWYLENVTFPAFWTAKTLDIAGLLAGLVATLLAGNGRMFGDRAQGIDRVERL